MCNCKELETFSYKGEVTALNYDLCQFTLDDQFKVYAGYIKQFKANRFKMPSLNEEIIISKAIFVSQDSIFLLDNSLISCLEYSNSELNRKSNYFIKVFINMIKMGINDILHIEKTYEKFKMVFPDDFINKLKLKDSITSYQLLLRIFLYLLKKGSSYRYCLCRNILVDGVELKYPYQFQIIEHDAKPIAKKIGYSYTSEKEKLKEVLIGFLSYNNDLKYLMLSDAKFNMLCVVGCDRSYNLNRCINKFLFIKNYMIITEMCKETIPYESRYIYFHIRNIRFLNTRLNNPEMPFQNPNLESYQCDVIHRGMYCFNLQNKTEECWVHLKILMENPFECLLTSTHIFNIYPFIDSGTQLIIQLPKSDDIEALLNKYRVHNNIELNRIFTTIPAYVLPPQFPIELPQPSIQTHKRENIISFEEAMEKMAQKDTDPVSFIAIIRNKILKPPLYSRTAGKNVGIPKIFGTPGKMTHVLTVCSLEDKNKTATIYLNNWEAIQSPIGLIIGMKIIIGYVIPQKTYFKSCLLTSFQPLELVGYRKISTCYEYTNNLNWGPFAMLSKGKKLPENSVCWCPIYRTKLRRFQVRSKCMKCKRDGLFLQKTCCNDDKFLISMHATLIAHDFYNCSTITVDNIEIFLTILNIDKKYFEPFMTTFADLRVFEYSAPDIRIREKTQVTFYAEPIASIMETLVIFLDSKLCMETNVDLKCIHSAFNTRSWHVIEARPSQVI